MFPTNSVEYPGDIKTAFEKHKNWESKQKQERKEKGMPKNKKWFDRKIKETEKRISELKKDVDNAISSTDLRKKYNAYSSAPEKKVLLEFTAKLKLTKEGDAQFEDGIRETISGPIQFPNERAGHLKITRTTKSDSDCIYEGSLQKDVDDIPRDLGENEEKKDRARKFWENLLPFVRLQNEIYKRKKLIKLKIKLRKLEKEKHKTHTISPTDSDTTYIADLISESNNSDSE